MSIEWTAAEREAVLAGLRDSGLTDGNDGNPHSWRCAYPDRYGPCECATETASFVLGRLAEFVAERERAAAAKALRDAAGLFNPVTGSPLSPGDVALRLHHVANRVEAGEQP